MWIKDNLVIKQFLDNWVDIWKIFSNYLPCFTYKIYSYDQSLNLKKKNVKDIKKKKTRRILFYCLIGKYIIKYDNKKRNYLRKKMI